MKLWISLTTCLILLSAVHVSPLPRSRGPSPSTRRRGRIAERPLEAPPVHIRVSVTETEETDWAEGLAAGEQYTMEEPIPGDYENVVDFIKVTISRIRRSPSSAMSSSTSFSATPSPLRENLSNSSHHRREKKSGKVQQTGPEGRRRGARDGASGRRLKGGGRGQGCVLKQIQLNVTDLGLGYRSGEEMIFRYCSGPCRKSETNYDKILYSLAHNRRIPSRDAPPQACCRPIAFDDDISFLDDNLVYHTVRKHSARKCGCV